MGGSRQDSDDKCGIHFHWAGGYQAGALKLRLLRKLCAVWGNEVYAGSDVSINIYQYILTFFNIIDNLDDALLEESYYTAVLKMHQFAKFFQSFCWQITAFSTHLTIWKKSGQRRKFCTILFLLKVKWGLMIIKLLTRSQKLIKIWASGTQLSLSLHEETGETLTHMVRQSECEWLILSLSCVWTLGVCRHVCKFSSQPVACCHWSHCCGSHRQSQVCSDVNLGTSAIKYCQDMFIPTQIASSLLRSISN